MIGTTIAPPLSEETRRRAREEESDLCCMLQLVSSDNRRSRGRPQHHAGVAVSPPYSMCLVACLGSLRFVSVRGQKVRACAACCPCRYPHPPRGHRRKFRVHARSLNTATPAPDHNNSSSSFVSVNPSFGPCLQQRTNPVLAVARTRFPYTFKLKQDYSRNIMTLSGM